LCSLIHHCDHPSQNLKKVLGSLVTSFNMHNSFAIDVSWRLSYQATFLYSSFLSRQRILYAIGSCASYCLPLAQALKLCQNGKSNTNIQNMPIAPPESAITYKKGLYLTKKEVFS